jgi:hypothetical protein
MARAVLLDRVTGAATAEIDVRSNRPVSEQVDEILHAEAGGLLAGWWCSGGERLWIIRIVVGEQTMMADGRLKLRNIMAAQGFRCLPRWLKAEAGKAGTHHPGTDFAALGRDFHAWNNDPRGAVLEEPVTLNDGTVKQVQFDMRVWINQTLKGWEAERRRRAEEARGDGG